MADHIEDGVTVDERSLEGLTDPHRLPEASPGPQMSAPLGAPFWRLFASSATSNLADGVVIVAAPLLAASWTKNPVLVSGLSSLQFLPWLLFSLPGGALVDRMDRRWAMAAANGLRALALAVLGVLMLFHPSGIFTLYAVVFTLGSAQVVYDSAVRAVLPQVVSPSELDRGNSWLTVEENVGQTLLGAPLGALLFSVMAAIPFLGTAAGFVLAALLILTLKGNFVPARAARTTIREDIAEGLAWLWRNRLLRGLTVASAATVTLGAMVNGILVLYGLEVIGLDQRGFGIFLAAAGIGGLLGALITGRLISAIGRVGTLIGVAILGPVLIIPMAFTHSRWLAGGLFLVTCASVTVWNVVSMSLRQSVIPGQLFGRVLSVYRMVIWGGIPVGSLAGGLLAHATTLSTVFAVSGAGQLLVAGSITVLLRRHRDEIDRAYLPK